MRIIRLAERKPTVIACRKADSLPRKRVSSEVMGEVDKDAFRAWVRDVANRMKLTDYSIVIPEQPCEKEYLATMESDFSYRQLKISLCVGFFNLDPVKQRDTIVHELAHGLVHIFEVPYHGLQEAVAPGVWDVVEHNAMASEENFVTALEWIIGPTMPLPPEWGGKRPKKK